MSTPNIALLVEDHTLVQTQGGQIVFIIWYFLKSCIRVGLAITLASESLLQCFLLLVFRCVDCAKAAR